MKTKKTKSPLPEIEMDSPDPDMKGGATAQPPPPKRPSRKPTITNRSTKRIKTNRSTKTTRK